MTIDVKKIREELKRQVLLSQEWDECPAGEAEDFIVRRQKSFDKLYSERGYRDIVAMVKPDNFDIPLPEDTSGNSFLKLGSQIFSGDKGNIEEAKLQWEAYNKALNSLGNIELSFKKVQESL